MARPDLVMVNADHLMANVEKALNIPGYFPIVSSFTGPFRAAIGKVEIVAALFIGLYVLFTTGNLDWAFNRGVEYAIHGASNIFRGVVEFIPFLGNYLCWAHDKEGQNRHGYTFENVALA